MHKETDSALGAGAFGPEPDHDRQLGTLLQSVVGSAPVAHVNWTQLERRIATAVEALKPTPWWGYAARWERRAIPLALAAGIAGAFTLWSASGSMTAATLSENPEMLAAMLSGAPAADAARSVARADFLSAIVNGAPATDAVRSFARSITGTADVNIEIPQ